MTEPQPLQQVDRTYVRFGKRKLSYFAGCDYFRLASHPQILRAMREGLRKYGLNVAASRMTTGNHKIFGQLEKTASHFFQTESATLVANGYATNLIVAQALAGEFPHVLIDAKAHPSLKDAAKFFQSSVHVFRHRDVADVARVVQSLGKNVKLCLLTDGMFSSDGAIAPLRAYLHVLPAHALLLVDDAHGAGTLGQTGQGVVELENVPRPRVVQTVTLSKAFGVYGGLILGPRPLREKILARSGLFVGSTPLPLPLANAAQTALHILQKEKDLRKRLAKNVIYVKSTLNAEPAGKPTPHSSSETHSSSPIIPVIPKNEAEAEQIKKCCLRNGIFPPFIKYPGGPENGYFRFVLSSEHSQAQLRALVDSLAGS